MAQVITSQEFDAKVLQASGPVLVDFFATWCGPCRMVSPIIGELASEYEGRIKVGKVNVDEAPELAMKYGVSSIPTLILFRDGREAGRTVGAQGKEQLDAFIDGCK